MQANGIFEMQKKFNAYPKARKRFGQNFLHDQGVIEDIITTFSPQKDELLVEIGPGRGALTGALLAAGNSLDVIELDRDLIPLLRIQFATKSHLRIHEADALSFDYRQLQTDKEKRLRVIGNLPYNITTPLLFHLLSQSDCIQDMCFMLQKEVVERMCAKPGSKTYGRLSIMVQYQCETENVFIVPATAFEPQPKVESAIIYLKPRDFEPQVPLAALREIVSQAFSQRRKTIANTLKSKLTEAQLFAEDIDPKQRPETVSLTQYVNLTRRWIAESP